MHVPRSPSGSRPVRTLSADDQADFQQWAGLFYSWEVYKILVQRKEKTDASYKYSSQFGESLSVAEDRLTPAEHGRMTELEKKLGR